MVLQALGLRTSTLHRTFSSFSFKQVIQEVNYFQ